jgi:hypothetical protein
MNNTSIINRILFAVTIFQQISAKGVQVHWEKIMAILDWSTPKNVTKLRSFFGICNYYRRFVSGFSHLGAPLTDFTRHGAFIWTNKSHRTWDLHLEKHQACRKPQLKRIQITPSVSGQTTNISD